jgi:hypothetical protein
MPIQDYLNIIKKQCCREIVSYTEWKQNMMSLRGQASWAKMTSLGGKLTASAGHPTKYANKAE